MPELQVYFINEVPASNEDLNQLLLSSIPQNQQSFYFNMFAQKSIYCNFYFFSLRDAVSKFTEYVNFSNLILSKEKFCSIIKAAKGTKNLIIQYCTIMSDSECDFGEMSCCKIQNLKLFNCGDQTYSNWGYYNEKLYNIIFGISICENMKK